MEQYFKFYPSLRCTIILTGQVFVLLDQFQAEPLFREPRKFSELVDPLLKGNFPRKSLNQAVAIAAMCVNEDASVRPLISDVVTALSYLWVGPEAPGLASTSPSVTLKGVVENNHELNDISANERQKAVAEAIEWGSNSRTHNIRSLVTHGSSA